MACDLWLVWFVSPQRCEALGHLLRDADARGEHPGPRSSPGGPRVRPGPARPGGTLGWDAGKGTKSPGHGGALAV